MKLVIKILSVLVLVWVLTACGVEEKKDIDPAFSGYLALFLYEGNNVTGYFPSLPKSLTIKFVPVLDDYAGWCSRRGGEAIVTIDKREWEANSSTWREMLMFHELGHCVLGRGHIDTLKPNGKPESLMHRSLFSESYYRSNRQDYLDELFGGG